MFDFNKFNEINDFLKKTSNPAKIIARVDIKSKTNIKTCGTGGFITFENK